MSLGLQVARKTSTVGRSANLRPSDIEGYHLRSLTRKASTDLPFTATDVQYPSSTACIALD